MQYKRLRQMGMILIGVLVAIQVTLSTEIEKFILKHKSISLQVWIIAYIIDTSILTCIFLIAIGLLIKATRTMDKIESTVSSNRKK